MVYELGGGGDATMLHPNVWWYVVVVVAAEPLGCGDAACYCIY